MLPELTPTPYCPPLPQPEDETYEEVDTDGESEAPELTPTPYCPPTDQPENSDTEEGGASENGRPPRPTEEDCDGVIIVPEKPGDDFESFLEQL